MPPAEEAPAAELYYSPRPLCQIADGTCFLQGQDVLRARLAHPLNGTRPSPIEGRGSQAHARALDQTDIAAKIQVPQVPQCQGGACAGSTLVRGQARTQGCGERGHGACLSSPVVPAQPADQDSCSQMRPEMPRRSAAGMGYRRPVRISTSHSDSRGVGFEGGTAKTPPRTLVNSGVGTKESALGLSVQPTALRLASCNRPCRTGRRHRGLPPIKLPKWI